VVASALSQQHPLGDLVPPPRFREEYIPRSIEGVEDLRILDHAMSSSENVLLFGPTGPGKTSLVYAYAASRRLPLVCLACNGAIDPATLWGRPELRSDGHGGTDISYAESAIVTLVRNGGVLYLDEINFAPPRIMAVLHGALDKRRQVTVPDLGNETITLHPRCQVIASMNVGYNGTKPLNQAFKNRFPIKLMFDYEPEIERKLITLIPTLVEIAQKLRASGVNGDLETPVAANLLQEYQDHALSISTAFATEVFLNAFEEHERAAVGDVMEHYSRRLEQEARAARALLEAAEPG
jgi:nitric oxide reductase NorQ protein